MLTFQHFSYTDNICPIADPGNESKLLKYHSNTNNGQHQNPQQNVNNNVNMLTFLSTEIEGVTDSWPDLKISVPNSNY